MVSELSLALMVPEHLNPDGVVIRMTGTSDDPRFCLVDACQLVGLSNPREVAKNQLDKDDVSLAYVIDSMGRQQMAWFVNSRGMFNLLMRSDKPFAKPLQRWVYEVIDCIRIHKQYPAPVGRQVTEVVPSSLVDEFRTMREEMAAIAARIERRMAASSVIDRVPGVVEARQYIRELWKECPDKVVQNIIRRMDNIYREGVGRPAPKIGYAISAPLACEYEHMRILLRAVAHYWREEHPSGPEFFPGIS
jgi:prophage antirepressor-like protein